MGSISRFLRLAAGAAWLLLWPHLACAETTAPSPAERVFASAPERLLQLRTLVSAADKQASIGSGFLVSPDGLAITNYHVAAQVALEPELYRLEYVAEDNSRGKARLLAIDLANDLAVVRIEKDNAPIFTFDEDAMAHGLPKGERLYSMGNPLDLGFTVVEGSYSGLVERSYNERIHFTGALNPGMSGGPTVNTDGRVVGVNVARQIGGELVSFLVPARFAARLLERARTEPPPNDFRAEIGRQLADWQATLYQSLADAGFRSVTYGPYRGLESAALWVICWAQTNADARPKPRASVDTTNCSANTRVFIADDLNTGAIQFSQSHVRTIDLNPFQFATFLSRQSQPTPLFTYDRNHWYTPPRCHEDFVVAAANDHPRMHAVWCARAYRSFAGLYDVSVAAVTQNRGDEALVVRLNLQAVGYEAAMTLTRRILEAVQWSR